MAATIGIGGVAIVTAAIRTPTSALPALAVLAAVAALSELFTIPADSGSLNPLDAHGFSFSVAVH
ncbi:MAG: hypothetical protein E6G64_16995, partial [Actinobacteria bacterium]